MEMKKAGWRARIERGSERREQIVSAGSVRVCVHYHTSLLPPNHRVVLVPIQMVCSPESCDVNVNRPSAE